MKREHPDTYYARKILRDLERAVADPAPIPWRMARSIGRIQHLTVLTLGDLGYPLAQRLLNATVAARDKIRARAKAGRARRK